MLLLEVPREAAVGPDLLPMSLTRTYTDYTNKLNKFDASVERLGYEQSHVNSIARLNYEHTPTAKYPDQRLYDPAAEAVCLDPNYALATGNCAFLGLDKLSFITSEL